MNTNYYQAHCNTCGGERNHSVLYSDKESWEDDLDSEHRFVIHGWELFEMLKCLGCNGVKLRHTSYFSEAYDENGKPLLGINYYPPAIYHPAPKWLKEFGGFLPKPEEQYIIDLLNEIYSAIYNNSRRLAVMGVRALIEYIMIAKIGDRKSFKMNLAVFMEAGYITINQSKFIESILDAGHASIHRGYSPTNEDLQTVIKVAESLIETIYVHPIKTATLKSNVPKRTKRSYDH